MAILLDSGVTVKKAFLFNVVSSLFSLVGAVLGLLIGESEAYAEWVYAFTAGSFLYIAMATLVRNFESLNLKKCLFRVPRRITENK